jgi:hypothetical protein
MVTVGTDEHLAQCKVGGVKVVDIRDVGIYYIKMAW